MIQLGKANQIPPPHVNGKPYKWMGLTDIENITGACHDELNIVLRGCAPFLAFDYRRLAPNCWALMHGPKVLRQGGKPIVWNDTILKATMRPDVAIVNASTDDLCHGAEVIFTAKSFFTCSQ
jgi:hypothetical protein